MPGIVSNDARVEPTFLMKLLLLMIGGKKRQTDMHSNDDHCVRTFTVSARSREIDKGKAFK